MEIEDWPNAREAATSAVNLDPSQPLSLIRLSTCYNKDREYVKAYDALRKGVGLLPPVERAPYKAKLAHLLERRNDALANIPRVDPFERLPLEVIINIMQYGLIKDRHYVLQCTWVSKTWNIVLVHKCPELWGTLTFAGKDLQDKLWHEKRRTWIQRAGNNIHTVVLDGMKGGLFSFILKSYEAYFLKAKIARITMKDNGALRVLCQTFNRGFYATENLYIDGGDSLDSPNEQGGIKMLDCNLLDPGFVKRTLKLMEVRSVDYRRGANGNPSINQYPFDRYEYDSTDRKRDYSALTSLSIIACKFSISDRDSNRSTYECCPLHNMLKGASGLQVLKVVSEPGVSTRIHRNVDHLLNSTRRIVLENLEEAAIPPPTVMFINFHAPQLKRLSFVLPERIDVDYDHRSGNGLPPLIPLIAHSPITFETLGSLTHLELEAGDTDRPERMGTWLSHLPNLVSLSIRGNKSWFKLPKETKNLPDAEQPVYECIVKLLADHPEWMPKLTSLELTYCKLVDVDEEIRQFVEMRQLSSTAASLTKLTLAYRNELSSETHAWLHAAVQKSDGTGTGFSHRIFTYSYIEEGFCEHCEIE
jgi:hypothetical protein